MQRLVLIILLSAGLGLQAQVDTLNRLDSLGRKTGHWIYFGADGMKIYDGVFAGGHPVGRFTRFHPNGMESAVLLYDSTGTRVDARLFDPEGRLRASGIYINQRKEGLWEFLSEKNLPVFRITYQNGLLHGDAWRFDVEGKPVEKTQWKYHVLDGVQILFAPEGYVRATIQYRDGKMTGLYKILLPDGSPEVTGQYADGLKDGEWTYCKPDGTVDYRLNFRKGKLLNPEILNARQREAFERYERNQGLLKDPKDFITHPEDLINR